MSEREREKNEGGRRFLLYHFVRIECGPQKVSSENREIVTEMFKQRRRVKERQRKQKWGIWKANEENT